MFSVVLVVEIEFKIENAVENSIYVYQITSSFFSLFSRFFFQAGIQAHFAIDVKKICNFLFGPSEVVSPTPLSKNGMLSYIW